MADLTDVTNALVGLVEQAVYPNGLLQPSVAGVDVSIFAGHPIRNKLDDTMQAGKAMVSVFPTNKERDVTKFFRDFKDESYVPNTITAEVVNDTVTIGGTVSVPQSVVIIVDGVSYGYPLLITDTVDSIAASLSSLITGSTVLGSVITIPFDKTLVARIAVTVNVVQELGRRERVFNITCWTNDPSIRALLAPPIDILLQKNYRFVLPDGVYCHVWYDHTEEIDDLQIPLIYRRNLFYRVQYATTNTEQATSITSVIANVELTT